MNKEHCLIGKTIIDMKIANDRKALLFLLNDGSEIVARSDGDCCSNSWIENVVLPALGFPVIVYEAHDIEMPDLGNGDSECISYYGFQINTDKGAILVDYRNESNGYYGGSLEWPGDYFYGGVFGQNISKLEWKGIRT